MHLSSLTLENVRQFDRRTFEFQPGFNLLVGENGAGKTTILRGLLAALGNTQKKGQRLSLEDDDIRLHARQANVIARVQSSNGQINEFYFRKMFLDRPERSPTRRERPTVLLYASNEATCSAMQVKRAKQITFSNIKDIKLEEDFLYKIETNKYNDFNLNESPSYFGNSQSVRNFVRKVLSTFSKDFRDFYWRFEPYDCSLIAPNETLKKKPLNEVNQKQAKVLAMRFFQESWQDFRKRPFDWPDQPKVTLTPEPSGLKWLDRESPDFRDLWFFWEEMGISPETLKVLKTYSLEVKLTPRIRIRREIGPLSLSQLSDGEQRLFSLFVDITRQLLLRNPGGSVGGGEAIVMIDEIDVHLYPKWQRKIVPALEDLFPKCQFIATTHSPFVIQATDRRKITSIDNVNLIDILDGGNSIEDIAEDVQGVSLPQRSLRSEELSKAATEYFMLLKKRESKKDAVMDSELRAAEKRYRDASEPFTQDSAVHAFLKVQLIEGENQ